MGLKDDILSKVKGITETNFEFEVVDYVPSIDDSKLTFKNKGLKFEATVLYIDMRGSTKILNNHNKPTVAKIHTAFLHTISKVVKDLGGYIRSFNGDAMLVFFPGKTKTSLSNAVKAAMNLKFILIDSEESVSKLLGKKYSEIKFGIGIDDGNILCTKVGLGGDVHNKDLIWLGNPVNKAVKMGDSSNSIVISERVYDNLYDHVKYHQGTDMWQQSTINYNGVNSYCYLTSYHWKLD